VKNKKKTLLEMPGVEVLKPMQRNSKQGRKKSVKISQNVVR
jgi:hypothetical protein